MVESGLRKMEAVNDNILPGDFVVVTNPSLQPAIENYFGKGTRLRIAQVTGDIIDIVASDDYKRGMKISKQPLDVGFCHVKSWGVSERDVRVIPIAGLPHEDPRE
jgi:hypothetical protein